MAAQIHRGTLANLHRLARVLRRGGLVAVPTETVYGLAANALNAQACRRIFRAKRRPANDPLIVHVADLRMLEQVAEPNDAVARLARAFWPGPLTLILARKAVGALMHPVSYTLKGQAVGELQLNATETAQLLEPFAMRYKYAQVR